MKKGRGGGEAPMQLIEFSELIRAICIIKNRYNHNVCSKRSGLNPHGEACRSQFFCQRRIKAPPRTNRRIISLLSKFRWK